MRGLKLTVLLALTCAPAVALAQEAPSIPQRLSMEEAVRLAVERNPQAAAARALIDIAEADRIDVGLRPNPAATVETDNYPLLNSPRPGFINGQELTIRVDQEIETAGRRRLRTEAAAEGVAAANLVARDRLRLLELAVRRAYLQLALAQADAAVARTSLDDIDRVLSVSRERVKVGETARAEVGRLVVERLRFADDAFAADLALKNSRAALLTLFGAGDLSQVIEARDPLGLPSTPAGSALVIASALIAPLVPGSIEGRPDLLAARAQVRRTETETRLQRALRSPNATVGGGYKRDFGTNAFVFGVTVPLSLWNKNQGGIARADAERQLAVSTLALVELDVRLDLQRSFNAVETARTRTEYIERQTLASARESRDVVAESYRLGATDLINFLDAQRAFRDTLRTYNRALFDYRVSLFELDAARGLSTLQR